MMNDAIVFEDWEVVLKAEVPPNLQRRYREAIVKFRYWLREKGKETVPDTFKEHLAWKQSENAGRESGRLSMGTTRA